MLIGHRGRYGQPPTAVGPSPAAESAGSSKAESEAESEAAASASRLPSGCGSGTAASSARVYGCSGADSTACHGPRSTNRARYMTPIRSLS